MRQAALRALAAKVREPAAEDLGAASAALRSDEAAVRLEAARTFLKLAARLNGAAQP